MSFSRVQRVLFKVLDPILIFRSTNASEVIFFKNQNLKKTTGILNYGIFKNYSKFLKCYIFWNLILEQTVSRIDGRNVWNEFRTLYSTLRTLENEILKKFVGILSNHIFRNLPGLFLKSFRNSRFMLILSSTRGNNSFFR